MHKGAALMQARGPRSKLPRARHGLGHSLGTSGYNQKSPLETRPLPKQGTVNYQNIIPYDELNQNQTKILPCPSPARAQGTKDGM